MLLFVQKSVDSRMYLYHQVKQAYSRALTRHHVHITYHLRGFLLTSLQSVHAMPCTALSAKESWHTCSVSHYIWQFPIFLTVQAGADCYLITKQTCATEDPWEKLADLSVCRTQTWVSWDSIRCQVPRTRIRPKNLDDLGARFLSRCCPSLPAG